MSSQRIQSSQLSHLSVKSLDGNTVLSAHFQTGCEGILSPFQAGAA
jgi:hypothetical protein